MQNFGLIAKNMFSCLKCKKVAVKSLTQKKNELKITDKSKLKKALVEACHQIVDAKIAEARKGIAELEESSSHETKSSAGDKYETGRAMMQLEKEKLSSRLAEAMKWQKVLAQINIEKKPGKAELGSLVITNQGLFFLSIAGGNVKLEGKDYFLVSLASPAGAALKDKKPGDRLVFNGRAFEVLEVW